MLKTGRADLRIAGTKRLFPFVRTLLGAWSISILVWGAISLAFGWQMSRALSLAMPDVMQVAVRDGLVWGFATPLIFRITERFPIGRERWKTALPVHLAVCLAFLSGAAWLGQTFAVSQERRHSVEGAFRKEPAERPDRPQKPPKSILGGLVAGPHLPIYLTLLSVAHALHFYRRAREREVRAMELAAGLAEARLQALRMQIQPHFLFNSLNALGTLVHKDAAAADEMLAVLSDFLRLTLDDATEQEVPLHRELEYVEHYLKLEKIRFGDRLKYQVSPDHETLAAYVPALVLQPLIENAVRHGIELQRGQGVICIRSWHADGVLHLTVRDNGVGTEVPPAEGIGLPNIRARLHELYGAAASMTLCSGGGTEVKIRLPLRFA